jgi:hypothetical protein
MPFKKLIYFLLSMIKESSQNALERYFGKLGQTIHMSQQAFSQGRQKLKWQALREIFETTVTALCGGTLTRWRGYRLLAIGGSKINLPNDPDVREYFGVIRGGEGSPCAQGSILYDIENDLIAGARLEPIATGERTLAQEHIQVLCGLGPFGKELIIFDRGYASIELIELLFEKKIDFLMRVKKNFDAGIDALNRGDHSVIPGKPAGVRWVCG